MIRYIGIVLKVIMNRVDTQIGTCVIDKSIICCFFTKMDDCIENKNCPRATRLVIVRVSFLILLRRML